MLFRCRLSELNFQQISEEVLNASFLELIRAHRLGYHLLVLERPTSEFLLSKLDLNRRDRAILQRIALEYAQTGKQHLSASVYIDVDAGHSIRRAGNCISLPISFVDHGLVGHETALVVEDDETDRELYTFILNEIKRSAGLLSYRADVRHGGGEGIVGVFRRLIADRRIVVALLDEDKKSPHHPTSLKAKRLRHASDSYVLSDVICPPCHEVENLIPNNIVFSLPCAVGCAWTSLFASIEASEAGATTATADRYWLYFDIKRGLTPGRLAGIPNPSRGWIMNKLAPVQLPNSDENDNGFGSNVVSALFESAGSLAAFRRELARRDWKDHFFPSFLNVIWWFAAPSPTRT